MSESRVCPHIVTMTEAHSLFETALRISAVADSEEERQTAAGLMKQAADLGHGRAAGDYGNMLMAGRGVFHDAGLAYRYWSLGALEYGEAECAFKLGLACRDGGDFAPDLAGALAWFMLARDLGMDLAALDVDAIAYEINEDLRAEAFRRYDRLRSNCTILR